VIDSIREVGGDRRIEVLATAGERSYLDRSIAIDHERLE